MSSNYLSQFRSVLFELLSFIDLKHQISGENSTLMLP